MAQNKQQKLATLSDKDSNGKMGFWHRIVEYTQSSTLHGISYISNPSKSTPRRSLWLLVFLACVGTQTYFASRAVKRYLNFPTTSTTEYLYVDSLEFPSISICNANPLRKSYYKRHTASGSLPSLIFYNFGKRQMQSRDFFITGRNDPMGLTERESLLLENQRAKDKVDLEDLFRTGGHKYSKMVSCEDCNDDAKIQCNVSSRYWSPVASQVYQSVCYTTTLYDRKHKNILANKTNVEMFLDTQPNNYIFSMEPAVYLSIHAREDMPYDFLYLKGGGYEYSVTIEQKEVHNLPYPYGTCVDTLNKKFVNPLKYHPHYSYEACREEGITDLMQKHCGCHYYYHQGGSAPTCNYTFMTIKSEHDKCWEKIRGDLGNRASCNRACHNVKYTLQYRKEKAIDSSIDIKLLIEFKELAYTKTSQSPAYPADSLFGEVGGQLGLFLGASLLTLMECLDLLAISCISFLTKKKQHSQTSGITNQNSPSENNFI
jgi:hypothetical protein